MPLSEASNLPIFFSVAPVNAPFSWPKSSLSRRVSVMAAQLRQMKGPSRRSLALGPLEKLDAEPSPEVVAGKRLIVVEFLFALLLIGRQRFEERPCEPVGPLVEGRPLARAGAGETCDPSSPIDATRCHLDQP